jgi:hypothetical protein
MESLDVEIFIIYYIKKKVRLKERKKEDVFKIFK